MARQRLGLQLPQNQFLVSRIFAAGLLAIILVGSTGCLRHNTRGGDCSSCQTGTCNTGSCNTGSCGMGDCGMGDCGDCGTCSGTSSGILTKMANRRPCGCSTCGSGILGRIGGIAGFKCKNGNCNGGCGSCQGGGCGGPGCISGPFGWQQGGLGYSQHLNPGLMGHGAGAQLNNRAFTPGPPTGQTAYPYYTTRGPRDFLMANPPSIGR